MAKVTERDPRGEAAGGNQNRQHELPPPPPLPRRFTDVVPIVVVGSSIMFVVFAVLLVARLAAGVDSGEVMWTCLAGWVLGLIGLGVVAWQRAAARRGSRGAQQGLLDD
ncbi:DUF2530 domain-containing protein [Goodfellowiella coeruleoviolacea]|uniref:DUF2530 domain-containing protein n=1 Tax=Goodfellowiella coeruleoviolacea TaxID=334858 RepID=A0AAE3GL35_9PSEU|nr:DUF2530 domain-containing protein [Goodfellowiella coeruleoviolacea]MCP2169269.1 Protein of unknown function (DUF2530) [Goodfellowiella coeruleoviolacea]